MESRVEKYKRNVMEKNLMRKKKLLILFTVVMLFCGVKIVDDTYRSLMCVNNKKVVAYSKENGVHNFHFLGSNHYLEQKRIDDFIRDIEVNLLKIKNRLQDYKEEIF